MIEKKKKLTYQVYFEESNWIRARARSQSSLAGFNEFYKMNRNYFYSGTTRIKWNNLDVNDFSNLQNEHILISQFSSTAHECILGHVNVC